MRHSSRLGEGAMLEPRGRTGRGSLVRSLLLLVAAVAAARADGSQEPPVPREIRFLGGSTAVSPPLVTGADLARLFREQRNDMLGALRKGGWEGNAADLWRAIEKGSVIERAFPVGGRLQWMALRTPSGIGVVRDVRWAGDEPFAAFEVRLVSKGWRWAFVIPKACGNLALLSRSGTGELAVSVAAGELRLKDSEGREIVVRGGQSATVTAPSVAQDGEPRIGEAGAETSVRVEEGSLQFSDYGHPISVFLEQGHEVKASITPGGKLAFSVPDTNPGALPIQVGDAEGTLSRGSMMKADWVPPVCALSVSPASDFAGRAFRFDATGSSVSHGVLTAVELGLSRSGGPTEIFPPGVFLWTRELEVAGTYAVRAVAISDKAKRSENECTATLEVKPFAVLGRGSFTAVRTPAGLVPGRKTSRFGLTVVIAPEEREGVTSVRWETVREIELAGFELYRARGDGEPVKLNEDLVVASGRTGDGALYGYDDRPSEPGVYRYRLVAVDREGFVQRYEEVAEAEVEGR